MLTGLCPSLLFISRLLCFNTLSIEVIPIEAMEPLNPDSPATQVPPVQEPPTSMITSSPPITETVTAEEPVLLRQGPREQLQSAICTLRILPSRAAPTPSLLAQVSYTLDLRFPRRYVCVIFIITQDLEEAQAPWQRAFDSNMDKTNQIIQALS